MASRKVSKKRQAVKPGKQPSKGKKATRALTNKRRESARKGWLTRKLREYEKLEREAIEHERYAPKIDMVKVLKEDVAKGRKLRKAEEAKKRSMPRHTPKVDKEGFVSIPSPVGSPQSRAWATRRKNALIKEGVSALSARDWSELSKPRAEHLENFVVDAWQLAAFYKGMTRTDYFRTLIERNDTRMRTYFELCGRMGYTSRQARTAMFSPKARKK